MRQYTIEDISELADHYGLKHQDVWLLVMERVKTEDISLASAVADLTHKPVELYLVTKGVVIDPLPIKEPEPESTSDVIDYIIKYPHKVDTLTAEQRTAMITFMQGQLEQTCRIVQHLLKDMDAKGRALEILKRPTPKQRVCGTLADLKEAAIAGALERNNGNRKRTAKELGITVRGLRMHLNGRQGNTKKVEDAKSA